ncbi:MAG: energy-coupling factor transporter transmembrane protein EcfT [Clostridia bacterium]|nr:energy-coupling factor transporter transmembrane protein EcfT [Clostridia bacterium]
MVRDVTFGQYFPAKSIIHKIDPRLKLLLLISFIVFIFVCGNAFSLALMGAFTVALVIMSRVPIRLFLKSIKAIIIVIILTSILNALYVDTGRVVFEVWIIKITTGGIARAAFMSSRILILILASSLLTYTTTPTALTDAIERLLKPLRFIGLGEAVHVMAMMITIALRFIPTLIEETDKIMSAQKARGADMDSGSLLHRVKALIPILIPLLISSVRRAYDLADAMECRCYTGGAGRKRMKQLHLVAHDYVSLLVCIICFAGVIGLNILF